MRTAAPSTSWAGGFMRSFSFMRGQGTGITRAFAFGAMVLGASAYAPCARAQPQQPQPQHPQGFAVERFYPSAPGGGWFVMDALDLRGGLGGALALTTGYA